MSRRHIQQAEAPGHDSFLDVVANLVGIMIILIIVVGVATKKAIVEAGVTTANSAADTDDTGSTAAGQPQVADLSELQSTAAALVADIAQTDMRLQRDKIEIAYRQTEREKLLASLSVARKVIEQQREQLNDEEKSHFDLARQLDSAAAELRDLSVARESARRSQTPAGIIDHLPTPMAKTVFGKEIHFRLNQGRIVQVPWDELVEKLKADAPRKAPRLRDSATITETLGPVSGFWMKYTLRLSTETANVRGATVREQRVLFDHFVMIPVSEEIGEPMREALQPGSEFNASLQHLNPDRTTVTVWVYPDSFNAYRELKQYLFGRGFLCAARPLPTDHPLGGSPNGSRSSAQ